jgi:hypothetical protein
MKFILNLFLLFVVVTAYGQNLPMVIKKDAVKQLKKFKTETKYAVESSGSYYQGLGVKELQPKLNTLLNKVADDFIATASDHPTEEKFQLNIKKGLASFSPYYMDLDTEDREKTGEYFTRLMDCVGLKTSNGQLNKWAYGFEPPKK